MFVLFRAATYASLFIGCFLIFLPARLLFWSGVARPGAIGLPQILGTAIASWSTGSYHYMARRARRVSSARRNSVMSGTLSTHDVAEE